MLKLENVSLQSVFERLQWLYWFYVVINFIPQFWLSFMEGSITSNVKGYEYHSLCITFVKCLNLSSIAGSFNLFGGVFLGLTYLFRYSPLVDRLWSMGPSLNVDCVIHTFFYYNGGFFFIASTCWKIFAVFHIFVWTLLDDLWAVHVWSTFVHVFHINWIQCRNIFFPPLFYVLSSCSFYLCFIFSQLHL